MRLIVIGCEHTGKSTFMHGLSRWIEERLGEPTVLVHDHFLPHVGEGFAGEYTAEEEEAQVFTLAPFALEKCMRYMIHYHLGHHFYQQNDHLVVNWHYGDAVYAPLYFDYGGPGAYADRRLLARDYDHEVMTIAPDTVLLHLTATPDAIRSRMRATPRPGSRFREEDIELVRERFMEEFERSLIPRRFTLDTSEATPAETLGAFLGEMGGYWSEVDRLRLLTHRALRQERAALGGGEE